MAQNTPILFIEYVHIPWLDNFQYIRGYSAVSIL